jgi:hypothetical protein
LGLAKGTPLSERMAQSALEEQLLKGRNGGSSRVESSASQSSKKRIQSLLTIDRKTQTKEPANPGALRKRKRLRLFG